MKEVKLHPGLFFRMGDSSDYFTALASPTNQKAEGGNGEVEVEGESGAFLKVWFACVDESPCHHHDFGRYILGELMEGKLGSVWDPAYRLNG